MGTKVENCEQMGHEGDIRKYLFFNDALFTGDTTGEGHVAILASSGRKREEVRVAGGYGVVSSNEIMIYGGGSVDLKILSTDPTPVVEFVKSLPGAEKMEIEPSFE